MASVIHIGSLAEQNEWALLVKRETLLCKKIPAVPNTLALPHIFSQSNFPSAMTLAIHRTLKEIQDYSLDLPDV